MSINATIAVPYDIMSNYLRGNPVSRIASMAQSHDKVWVISITNPVPLTSWDEHCPVLVADCENAIALQFHDIERKSENYPDAVFFNKNMAEKVVKFLRKANKGDSNDLLVVNCHAGISRSGAVSSFARSVFGIDYSNWKRQNPQVIPNGLVLELLFDAWEKNNIPV